MGSAGLSVSPGDGPIWFGGEGLYGRNSHEGNSGDATNLFGANGFVGFDLGDEEQVHPYVYGTGGFLVHQYSPGDSGADSESETKPAFGGGAGVAIPAGFWAEAKLLATSETKLIFFQIGFSFGGD